MYAEIECEGNVATFFPWEIRSLNVKQCNSNEGNILSLFFTSNLLMEHGKI